MVQCVPDSAIPESFHLLSPLPDNAPAGVVGYQSFPIMVFILLAAVFTEASLTFTPYERSIKATASPLLIPS